MEKRIKLSFTVGIEFICDSDDELIFDYKLTKEEFDKLVDIEVKQIWEEEHESWNDIEAFFPELFEKLRRKTIEEGFKKWGEEFEPHIYSKYVYDFFIPDEIYEAVRKTDEYKKYSKARKIMRKLSERRWHQETAWIKREINKGRWFGADISLDGIYSRGGMKADYCINLCGLKYEKEYTLHSSEIKIRISPHCNESFVQELITICSEKNSRTMTAQYLEGSAWILSCKSHEDNSDIKLFANLLDYCSGEFLLQNG